MSLQIFHSCSMECFPRFGSVSCDTGAWRNETLLQTFFYLRSLQVLSCNNFHGPGWKMGSLMKNMESWIACPSIVWRVTISKIRGSAGASLAANASYVSRAFVCSSFIHQVKLAVTNSIETIYLWKSNISRTISETGGGTPNYHKQCMQLILFHHRAVEKDYYTTYLNCSTRGVRVPHVSTFLIMGTNHIRDILIDQSSCFKPFGTGYYGSGTTTANNIIV